MSTDITKIKILEKEYQDKLVDTTYYAMRNAVATAVITTFAVPLILWKLKLLRHFELRLFSGPLLAMPAGYFVARITRIKSLEYIEKNYTF